MSAPPIQFKRHHANSFEQHHRALFNRIKQADSLEQLVHSRMRGSVNTTGLTYKVLNGTLVPHSYNLLSAPVRKRGGW